MDATLQDPLVGRALDGRYLVQSRIARGGMATVYLALDRRLDREVALKVMHAHLADDEQFTARFIREARSAARLSHPNVVQVYDQGADGDLLYLAMEYLRGRTLREVLAERRVLTPREALTVIEPVLDALSAAHRIGIVHRDVKPENVILTDEGRVKVADFGLARAATATTSTTGVLMGTVAYLAPELVLRGVADTRSDVYAAGIMLFELLTGRQPFGGDVPIQVAYQHVNDQVPAPSTLAPGLPAVLDEVVASATAREPDDRPADADELLTRLRAAHAELTPAQLDARPDPPPPGQGAGDRSASAGSPTEVFDPLPAANVTRALPDLAGPHPGRPDRSGLAGRSGTPSMPAPSTPGDGTDPDDGSTATEDAALASLLRRRRVIGMSALLVVLGLAVALAVTAWYFAAGPGAYTGTPKVVGLTLAQAQDALGADHLRGTEVDVFDPTAAGGVVVATVPEAGADVRKDGVVTLKVSKGPEIVSVPAVVGQQESAARAALTAAHLTEGGVQQTFSDQPNGQVLTANPDVGQQVRNGSSVALTVSKGPRPVDVPALKGMTQNDAEAALGRLRLGVSYGTPKNDDTVPAGSVLSQAPSSGTLLPGQKVTLVLSKGPVLVQVPDVVGRQIGDATTILQQAGFTVRRTTVLGGFFGTVRIQFPGAGSMAPRGSTILLTVV